MTWHFCLAPAVAMGEMPSYMWIYFVGPSLAAVVHGVMFYTAPPHHQEFGCFTPPLLGTSKDSDDEDGSSPGAIDV